MLAAFCLVVLFIFCGLFLGLIEVACEKNAEKKVRLIDKRKFEKMVDEEAKKKNKKYLKLTAGNFFAGSLFVCVDLKKFQHIRYVRPKKIAKKMENKKNEHIKYK